MRERIPTTRRRCKLEKCSDPNDLSDCEIITDVDGKVRKDWEEAALRRRMANADIDRKAHEGFGESSRKKHNLNPVNIPSYRAKSEESTSVSNHANSDADQNPNVKQHSNRQHQDIRDQDHADTLHGCGTLADGVDSMHVDMRKQSETQSDQEDLNPDASDARSDDTIEEPSLTGNIPSSTINSVQLDEGDKPSLDNPSPLDGLNDVGTSDGSSDSHTQSVQTLGVDGNPIIGDNNVIGREILKQTEEFQNADAEEWARRHRELQKQVDYNSHIVLYIFNICFHYVCKNSKLYFVSIG